MKTKRFVIPTRKAYTIKGIGLPKKGGERMMNYKEIDISAYPRKDHFKHFLDMENPFVSVTVQVDITDWPDYLKINGYPFFLSFQYAVVRAANRIPEFRQRIRDRAIIEYDFCNPSYTVALPDGTYRYCTVNANQPLEDYVKEATVKQKEAMLAEELKEEEGVDVQSLFFISSIPWLNFNACSLPYPDSFFSTPSFTWGKYQTEKRLVLEEGQIIEKDKTTIPVNVFANHALIDGLHIATFFSNLEEEISNMKL